MVLGPNPAPPPDLAIRLHHPAGDFLWHSMFERLAHDEYYSPFLCTASGPPPSRPGLKPYWPGRPATAWLGVAAQRMWNTGFVSATAATFLCLGPASTWRTSRPSYTDPLSARGRLSLSLLTPLPWLMSLLLSTSTPGSPSPPPPKIEARLPDLFWRIEDCLCPPCWLLPSWAASGRHVLTPAQLFLLRLFFITVSIFPLSQLDTLPRPRGRFLHFFAGYSCVVAARPLLSCRVDRFLGGPVSDQSLLFFAWPVSPLNSPIAPQRLIPV